MKKTLLTLALAFVALSLAAQQEPNYELAAQFSAKRVNNMVFSTSVTPNWFQNSDKFWYEWKTSKGTEYYIVDPIAKTKRNLFNMERLAMQITEITKDPFDAQHIPISKIELKDDKVFTFEVKCKLADSTFRFEYDYLSGKLTNISDQKKEKEYPRWANVSPDESVAVYLKNHNLYWMEMSDVEKLRENKKDSTVVEHQLTFDGIEFFDYSGDTYHGSYVKDTTERMSAPVIWSPDSKHFVCTKADVRHIKELWVINSTAKPRPDLETYKYQMPGEEGPHEQLYLFDMTTKTGKQIGSVDAFKDQALDIMSAPRKNSDRYRKIRKSIWMGNNEKFYFSRTSRDLKRIDFCEVTVGIDTALTVFVERSNTYIEFSAPKMIAGGKEFLEWSERNGWANIYRIDNQGNVKNNLNDAAYHVMGILNVDETAGNVYFTATGVNPNENPYYEHVYRIGINGGSPVRLDDDGFSSSSVSMSDDGKFFVNNFSRVDCAPRSALYNNLGQKIMDLGEADMSLLLQAGYKYPEQFKVKAADGVTDLWGVMYKPYDFDPNKKYPIIDYVYPGPQVEGNNIEWSKNFVRIDRLAQIGFIVITVGNRGGHPDRSKWYHNFGYGNLRDYGLEDQKNAIQQLASRHNFIDIERVGIHGHSGGGFMSTAAILTYPDFFKVAVSCAGNHDNSIYNRWWSEQHHGIKEVTDKDGEVSFKYSIDKNQDIAKNLKGHLMLVHGDIDNNVHPANTIRVVDALIKANKRFDMLILPGQRHGFGDMNEYFFWRMADYYSEWLLGASHRYEVDIRQLNND